MAWFILEKYIISYQFLPLYNGKPVDFVWKVLQYPMSMEGMCNLHVFNFILYRALPWMILIVILLNYLSLEQVWRPSEYWVTETI